jgi:hypothetical protein
VVQLAATVFSVQGLKLEVPSSIGGDGRSCGLMGTCNVHRKGIMLFNCNENRLLPDT